MKYALLSIFVLYINLLSAATKKVLFIGNSYTYVNNLPQLLSSLALSAGDTIVYDSSAPGGYTFENHCTNATTLSKIAQGNWDYVILQEQSQRPSFSPQQVATEVLPFAKRLDSLIHVSNQCAQTIFYMTWGRINGDASNCQFYPPVCNYSGMQQRLRQSYLLMSNNNNAITAPVGVAWQNVRNQFSSINLYASDGSHPSLEGSYLAACVLFSTIYKSTSVGLSYISTLPQATASQLQQVASATVLDSLDVWNTNIYYPKSQFSFNVDLVNNNTIYFQNLSTNALSYEWNFGDNTASSILSNPSHTYSQVGNYVVTLKSSNTCFQDIVTSQVNINVLDNPQNFRTNNQSNAINYSDGFINFVNNNLNSDVTIFNLLGKEVLHQKLTNATSRVDISNQNTGFYFITFNQQNFKFYKY